MTIFEMLGQSGILTLLGMGVVFLFLFLMVIVIGLVGTIISGKNPDKDTTASNAETRDGTAVLASAGMNNKDGVTAAISAAVTEYRKPIKP